MFKDVVLSTAIRSLIRYHVSVNVSDRTEDVESRFSTNVILFGFSQGDEPRREKRCFLNWSANLSGSFVPRYGLLEYLGLYFGSAVRVGFPLP